MEEHPQDDGVEEEMGPMLPPVEQAADMPAKRAKQPKGKRKQQQDVAPSKKAKPRMEKDAAEKALEEELFGLEPDQVPRARPEARPPGRSRHSPRSRRSVTTRSSCASSRTTMSSSDDSGGRCGGWGRTS